jgi:hypothetical protein
LLNGNKQKYRKLFIQKHTIDIAICVSNAINGADNENTNKCRLIRAFSKPSYNRNVHKPNAAGA